MATIILTALFGTILAGYLSYLRQQNHLVNRSVTWNSTIQLAEAGIEEALAQLNQNGVVVANNGFEIANGSYILKSRNLASGSYTVGFSTATNPIIVAQGSAPVPLSNVVACLNFVMVGRLRENKLMLQGVGSSSSWRRAIEKRNVAAGFSLVLQDDPYLPTDVTAFYPRGIPVLSFFTGSHDDYHRPTDTADKVDYEGLDRIARLARSLLLDVATAQEKPDYVKVASSDKGTGSRENLRAYLGTIPDYATEVQGVKLSGVRGGSPAEKAGLKGGDIIVEFAGQKVANIYDYTYALDAVKIGQPVPIVVVREGRRMTIQATPEARK